MSRMVRVGVCDTCVQPPYGRYLNQVPDGWSSAHDEWLARSAREQGWFNSTQKRKANKIMEVGTVRDKVYCVWAMAMAS